jgi:hypothetical protein
LNPVNVIVLGHIVFAALLPLTLSTLIEICVR